MGIYDNWTYTDLHQLNLDWILKQVKLALSQVNTLSMDFIELKEYVINFLNSLDIDQAVADELDEMYDDGRLASIIGTTLNDIQGQVDELKAKTDYFNISPIQDIIYNDSTGNALQGAVIDNLNRLYMYNVASNSATQGSLLVFDALTHQYLTEIPNVELYHGNGMCYKNGMIYSADFYDGNGNYSTGMSVFDLNNYSVSHHSELSTTGFNRCFGVSDYDDDNILVAMSRTTDRLITNISFLKVNVSTWDYQILPITFTNLPLNTTGSLLCDIKKVNDSIFLLTTFPNTLVEFKIDDTESITFNATYNLGNYDRLGIPYGELEGLTVFPTNYFGEKTLLFTCHIASNDIAGNVDRTYSAYMFNIDFNLPEFGASDHRELKDGQGQAIYVSNVAGTTLLEYGTNALPFRTLQRAIDNYNRDTRGVATEIRPLAAGTYIMGAQYNKKIRINNNSMPITILMGNTYRGCDIDIYHNDDSWSVANLITLNFQSTTNYGATISNCNVMLEGCMLTTDAASIGAYLIRFRRSNVKMSYSRIEINQNMTGVFAADYGSALFLVLDPITINGTVTYVFNINRQSILVGNTIVMNQTINRGTGSVIFRGSGDYYPTT